MGARKLRKQEVQSTGQFPLDKVVWPDEAETIRNVGVKKGFRYRVTDWSRDALYTTKYTTQRVMHELEEVEGPIPGVTDHSHHRGND